MEVHWRLAAVMMIRIGISAFLGGLIGWERERANQTAGLRTHILIALGAALVMCTGEYIYAVYSGQNSGDPARLGAQVVSGIGVLCAGTIMKGNTIKGLTTATGLWCSACIGLAAGSGNIVPAAGTALLTLIVLRFARLRKKVFRRKEELPLNIRLTLSNRDKAEETLIWLRENLCPIEVLRFVCEADDIMTLDCSFQITKQYDKSS